MENTFHAEPTEVIAESAYDKVEALLWRYSANNLVAVRGAYDWDGNPVIDAVCPLWQNEAPQGALWGYDPIVTWLRQYWRAKRQRAAD